MQLTAIEIWTFVCTGRLIITTFTLNHLRIVGTSVWRRGGAHRKVMATICAGA